MADNFLIILASSCGQLTDLLWMKDKCWPDDVQGRYPQDDPGLPMIVARAEGGMKMQKYYDRRQIVQARIQKDEIQQAVMIWLPAGFFFFELILHIFPKITWTV